MTSKESTNPLEEAAKELYPEKFEHCTGCQGMYGMSDVNYYYRQAFIAGALYQSSQGWISDKPKFDREFSFATAHWWKDHWEYKIWQVIYIDGDEGYYYSLCEGDGEEWGYHDDIQAELYYILPSPPIKQEGQE